MSKSVKKLTGYTYFTKQKRPEIKEKFPELKFGEITKKVAAEWKALSKEEQQKWNDEAKKQPAGDKKKATKKEAKAKGESEDEE